MKVKVQFHGILTDWMGVARAEIEVPEGGTLRDLYSAVKKTYGRSMPPQLSEKDPEALHRALWAIRGKDRLAEVHTELREGEEIQILLTLAGG